MVIYQILPFKLFFINEQTQLTFIKHHQIYSTRKFRSNLKAECVSDIFKTKVVFLKGMLCSILTSSSAA